MIITDQLDYNYITRGVLELELGTLYKDMSKLYYNIIY